MLFISPHPNLLPEGEGANVALLTPDSIHKFLRDVVIPTIPDLELGERQTFQVLKTWKV